MGVTLDSGPLLEVLGFTALHFLWQGLLVASILAITLQLMANQSPVRRYRVAAATFMMVLLLPFLTLNALSGLSSTSFHQEHTTYSVQAEVEHTLSQGTAKPTPSHPEGVLTVRPPSMAVSWIASIWIAGAFLLGIRLLGGIWLMNRLKRRQVYPVAEPLRRRLEFLAHRLGIHTPVWILESSAVTTPKLLGWLRPLILLPQQSTTNLSASDLDGVLLHELGHVRRQDPLMNLVQAFAEVILFFHPAIWWICNVLRTERENCCDDLAVAECGSPREYSKALLALENLRERGPALALGTQDGNLLSRIRRLLRKSEGKPRLGLPVCSFLFVLTLPFGLQLCGADVLALVPTARFTEQRMTIGNPRDLGGSSRFLAALSRPVHLHADDISLSRVLHDISKQTALAFDVPESIEEARVTLRIDGLPAKRILESMLCRKEVSFQYDFEAGVMILDWWHYPSRKEQLRIIDHEFLITWEDLLRRVKAHLDFVAEGKSLSQALQALTVQTGIRFVTDEDLSPHQAKGTFKDEPLLDIIEALLLDHGFDAQLEDNGLIRVIPRPE